MVRVDVREFRLAGELKAGPAFEEGVWRVCNDYKIERRERYLVPCGDGWETTYPLQAPGLIIELAGIREDALRLGDFEEPIVRFVRKRGLLGLDPWKWQGGDRETIKGYVAEIVLAADIVHLYEAVLNSDEDTARVLLDNFPCKALGGIRLGEDDRYYRMPPLEHALVEATLAVTRRVNDLCHVTAIPPKRSHDVSEVRTGWGFDSLIGAAYLQMYWLLAAGGGIARCDYCHTLIPNPRKDQRFCNERDGMKNKCRRDWNYHHGTGKSSKIALKAKRDRRKAAGSGSSAAAVDINPGQFRATSEARNPHR